MADDVADRRLVALRHLLRQRAQPHHQLVERLGVERLRRLERRAAGVDDLAAQHRELAALAAREQRGAEPGQGAPASPRRRAGRRASAPTRPRSGACRAGRARVRRTFHLLERGDDVEAAVRPVRRRLAQEPVRQLRQLARDAGIDVEDGRRLVGADAGQRLRRGLGAERRDAGHHLVEQRAEREQIGPIDRWPGRAPARATSHGRCRAPRPGRTGPARRRRDTSWPGRSRGSWLDRRR